MSVLPNNIINTVHAQQKVTDAVAMHECFPKFVPSAYSNVSRNPYKQITWKEKPFIKDGTWCFYCIPLAFGRPVPRKKISHNDAALRKDEFMILSDCQSP